MPAPRSIKRIAESTHGTPLASESTSRNGITTPANECRNPEGTPIDVYIFTPGGEGEISEPPAARTICQWGVRLASLTQFQWQEMVNGVDLARQFIAVHPGVTIEPGVTIPKFATVTSLALDGGGDETDEIAIDTRLRASFVQPQVTAPAWEADHYYSAGDRVTNDSGTLYVCVGAGTSAASGGPTGTGEAIVDNAASWDSVGTTIVTIDVWDQQPDFPNVGERLFIEGGGWYEIAEIVDGHLVRVINLGLPGAIVTLAS